MGLEERQGARGRGTHQSPNARNGNVFRPVDSEAKVAELHDAVSGYQDVLRFDVPVHH